MLKLQAILTPILLVALFITPLLGIHQPVEAQAPAERVEVVERRGETSKTYALGNHLYEMVVGGGIIHWKYDYEDSGEQWKEVDLTWDGPYLGTAPYEVWIDGEKVTFRNRKTGEVTTIERIYKPKGASFQVIPLDTGIALQHRLANLNDPFEAQFRIEGNARVRTRAWDDEGELELDVTFKDGILTERLSVARDAYTGQVRQTKGLIRIDPTLTVSTPEKDATLDRNSPTTNYGTGDRLFLHNENNKAKRIIAESDLSGLPSGSIITTATYWIYVNSLTGVTAPGQYLWTYKLNRTDWAENQTTWNIYKTGSNWTAAGGDYTTSNPAGVSWLCPDSLASPSWVVTDIVKDAIDTEGWSVVEFLTKFGDETYATNTTTYNMYSKEHGSLGPRLVIEYSDPIDPPAAPTNVSATDGAHTDKVAVTWTASVNATDYQVYRNDVGLGWAGNVTSYDDVGATAGTVTPGTASATDGTHTDKVALSLSGASANNGTTHTYKVRAKNDGGESADSGTDTGYRGVGALTYQWQRSAADSDASYGNIAGATSSSYDDTAAPAPTITAGTAAATNATHYGFSRLSIAGEGTNVFGRYYQCLVNATGAAQQTSSSNRGHRGVGSLIYQWQRSAGDSDASYSNLAGATTDPYDDTGAAETPDGRYYKCSLTATGAVAQTTNADRGSAQVDDPVVTTQAATYVGYASARLNSYVEYATATPPIEVRFQYHTTNNFTEVGVNATAWVGDKYAGNSHWATVSSLSSNTTYHFRAQARHDGITYNFTALNFTTEAGFGDPTNAYAYTEDNRIVLTWTRGSATEGTLIRFSTTSYPATPTSGTLVGSTALGTITHTGLSYGTTYYYTLWGYVGDNYTASITVLMTTGAGATDAVASAPTTPALWFTSADYTRFADMPLYTQVNDFADSLSIPYATLWILGAIGLCVLISLGVLMKTHRPAVALIVMGGLMIVMVLLNLVPGWMIAFIVLFFLGASKMASGSLGGAR